MGAEEAPLLHRITGKTVYRRAEPLADLGQRRSRGDRHAQLLMDVPHQTGRALQPRHVDPAVHPIDAINLKEPRDR